MFALILRKIARRPWLELCLLIGFIIAVALISSIHMYTEGVLQRLLIRDLESFQISTGKYPGAYLIKKEFWYTGEGEDNLDAYPEYTQTVIGEPANRLDLPLVTSTHRLILPPLLARPKIRREEKPKNRLIKIEGLKNIEEHITMLHGRLFSEENGNDMYEVIVTESAVKDLDLRLDEVYIVTDLEKTITHQVKVVGIFTIKDTRDAFWYGNLGKSNKSFFMDYSLINRSFTINNSAFPAVKSEWFFTLDYYSIRIKKISSILSALEKEISYMKSFGASVDIPMVSTLKLYLDKQKQLKITLTFLQIPVMFILAFFLYTVSLLIIGSEKNEIAVLKSRGAGTVQVFFIYLVSNLLLCGIALLIGPFCGLFICRVIGSTNGFFEFVRRTSLPVSLSFQVYLYSLAGIAFFLAAILVPTFLSSKTTIVIHKQKIARQQNSPFWKKYLIDFVLLAVSAYGLYGYHSQQKILVITGASGSDLPIDPLYYMIAVFFILGAGLLFLRVFPYLIRLIFRLGKRIWAPEIYASFIQIGRSFGYEKFVLIFLILTMAVGVFNSSAARTLNEHIEDKIRYENGADINLMPLWWSRLASDIDDTMNTMERLKTENPDITVKISTESSGSSPIPRKEPPFEVFSSLSGSKLATKVFRKENVHIESPLGHSLGAVLMGIIPDEFGKVAWFRSDLLPHHWHRYLNLMAERPDALLVSKSLKEKYSIEKGQLLSISWEGQKGMDGIVYEFIDYWPTFNPYEQGNEKKQNLIVANLSYVQAKMALEPYEVWIKRDTDTSSKDFYSSLINNGLRIVRLKDSAQDIIIEKNKPILKGTNGILTLGFLIILVISLIGFLICWIISIKGRSFQFGILRALGLSRKKLLAILVWEQLLVSGTAVLMGIVIGGIAGQLFIPLLQLTTSAAQQVPPLRIGAFMEDYIYLFLFVGAMLMAALIIMSVVVSRAKIHQVLKLGEE